MKCIKFKDMKKGALLGFADLEMDSGMIINECTLLESNGSRWVSPPGKPQIDKDKQVVFKDGKMQYTAVIAFRDKAVRDKWSAAAVVAIEAFLGGEIA